MKSRISVSMCIIGLAVSLGGNSSAAAGFELLHVFGTNYVGGAPEVGLTPGPDGYLYGVLTYGGALARGQVFKVLPSGTGYIAMHDFSGPDGSAPAAALILEGEWLYGCSSGGGSNDTGTVFKIRTNGLGFAVLKSFSPSDGENPQARLCLSGSTLYGVAENGGPGQGTVFKLNIDGSGFRVLHSFALSTGFRPTGGVVVSDGTLFGTTGNGGEQNLGTIYALGTDGNGFTILHSMREADGTSPTGGLVLDGETLYGTAIAGGTNLGYGTVFRLNTNGAGFVTLHSFDNAGGANPSSGVILVNSVLYGTAHFGGSAGGGVVFKVQTNGTGFSVLKDFANYNQDGCYPYAGLCAAGNGLFGAVMDGGRWNYGALFRIDATNIGFTRFLDFTGGDGSTPVGGLRLSGGMLYGTTEGGGLQGSGTVYRIGTNGSGYQLLCQFTNAGDARQPDGVAISASRLYGVLASGGAYDYGQLFAAATDGSSFTTLLTFAGTNGGYPHGPLTVSGDTLYGTTWGALGLARSVIYRVANGQTAVLHEFENDERPTGGLLLAGEVLYGTTLNGGQFQQGSIYRIHTNGTGFAIIKDFSAEEGAGPRGELLLIDDVLYGSTEGGGTGYGTLYRLNTNGSGFTVLKVFSWEEGSHPNGGLVSAGSLLYGSTVDGGFFSSGILFSIHTNGSGFACLRDFQAAAYPFSGPVLAGESLFGTCSYGEALDSGALFRLSPDLPVVVGQPPDTTCGWGDWVFISARINAYPPATLQWFCNGVAIPDATNENLIVSDAQRSKAGLYHLVASNQLGVVSTRDFTLTILDPWFSSQPSSQTVNASGVARFAVAVNGTTPFSYQWFNGPGPIQGSARITGALSNWLTISNAVVADQGDYYVVVTNIHGAVTSEVATLTIIDPFLVSPPTNQFAKPGQNITLSVTPGGTGPFTFQWRKNGALIDGATGSALSFSPLQIVDAGFYDVIVGNGTPRTAVSAPVLLSVDLTAATAFNIGISAPVNALCRQADGRMLVGGDFSMLAGQSRPFLGRLQLDGSLDPTFQPMLNGAVDFLALQRDGKILVGGKFFMVNGQKAGRIVRLTAAGDLDSTFVGRADDVVLDLLVQPDDKILVGGGVFSSQHMYIERWNADGAVDAGFNPHVSGGDVRCIALQPDGRILIGGYFGWVNDVPRSGLARLNRDGSVDREFDPHMTSLAARRIALLADGRVLASGFGGGTMQLMRFQTNGIPDTSFETLINGECASMFEQPDGKIVVAGPFTYLNGPVRYFGRLHPDGNLDPTFVPNPNGALSSVIREPDGRLFVGGSFTQISGLARNFLARLEVYEPPQVRISPAAQTAEIGSPAGFTAQADGNPPPALSWFFNGTQKEAQGPTLALPAVSAFDVGNYQVIASNIAGMVTSAPVVLNVIAPTSHRLVPALRLFSVPGDVLVVESRADLVSTWAPLESVKVLSSPLVYYDVSPGAPARFYRASEPAPAEPSRLELRLVPAVTLSGPPGSHVQVDAINKYGPTNAWFTVGNVVLTNSTQWFFDLSGHGQPARLYRLLVQP